MRIKILSLFFWVGFGASGLKADTLLTWDVTGTTGTSGSGAASAPVVGIAGSAMSAGAGTTAGNINAGVTSPANSWNRTYVLYADASAAQAANSFITWTTSVSDTYTLTITGFSGLTLAKTSTAGPTSAELYYSTDGTTFTKVGGTATVTSTLTSAASTFAPSSPIVVNGAAGGTTVTWRLVGFGAAGRMGIGNAGTDNFSILGTVTGGAAKNLTWAGGNGNWDGANAWLNGSTPATFSANDNVTINGGAINLPSPVASGSVAVGGSSDTTLYGGGLSGTTLTKTGSGNLTLAMANSFSGGTTVTGGTITLGADGALGSAALGLNAATVAASDPLVTSAANATTVGNGDATIAVGSGVSLNWGGAVAATGVTTGGAKGDTNSFNVLNKTGSGMLIFANNVGGQMSYDTTTKAITTAGAIQLNIASNGSVKFNAAKTMNLGSGTNLATFDTNTVPPTQLTAYNGMVWDGDFYLTQGTVQINGGNIQGAGKIYVDGGGTFSQRLNFNSPDIANPVDVTGYLTLSAASGGSIKLNGQITGNGFIQNTGSGGVVLGNTNPSTFTGTFNVAQTSASGSSRMTLKAQTLAAAAAVNFLSGQSNTPKVTIENSSTASGAVIACPISGPGELTKAYDGDVLLTGTNDFSLGLVLQDAGTLYVTNTNSLGIGPLVADSANSRIGLHSSSAENEITITNPVNTATTNTNGTTNYNTMAFAPGTNSLGAPRAIRLESVVTNVGFLKVSGGGNLFVNNTSNSYSGGTEIGTGAIVITNPAVLSTGPVNFGTTTNSFLRFSSNMTLTNVLTVSGVTTNSTNVTKYTANLSVDSGLSVNASGSIKSKGVVGVDQKYGARAEKWGAGTLVLSGSNNISESLSVNEGVLNLSTNTAVSSATALRFVGGSVVLSHSGTMNAGDLSVEGNAVLDLGVAGGRTLRFTSLASTFSSNSPVYLTLSNTANGSVYFPTNTSTDRLKQIKSAEQPTYAAYVDGTTGLLFFGPAKLDQTISFGSLAVKTVGDAAFALTATASSLLPVTYTSSNTNVATVSGNTVTIKGAGTTTITASQIGDGSYNAAPNVSQILVVNAPAGSTFSSWSGGATLNPANLAKYAFGGASSLSSSDGKASVQGGDANTLTLTVIVRTDDSSLGVSGEASTDLNSGWSSSGVSVTTASDQSGVPAGCSRKIFSVNRGTDGKKFLHLKATVNP